MSLLKLENLAIGYPRRTIARDISFSLAPGQALAVLGPNGSGKTTLFRTMLGLLAALAGRVELDGNSITALQPAEIARLIAYVPQSSVSFFNFSVLEVIEMARAPHISWFGKPGAIDRKIAIQALDTLSIAHFMQREFSELSGGERQLVLIARALTSQAKCLLLDEPTANLDFGNRLMILDTLRKLKASGVALIFTTHDPAHALRVCADAADRTMTIARDGQVDIGPTASMVNPQRLAALYGIDERVFADEPIALSNIAI